MNEIILILVSFFMMAAGLLIFNLFGKTRNLRTIITSTIKYPISVHLSLICLTSFFGLLSLLSLFNIEFNNSPYEIEYVSTDSISFGDNDKGEIEIGSHKYKIKKNDVIIIKKRDINKSFYGIYPTERSCNEVVIKSENK